MEPCDPRINPAAERTFLAWINMKLPDYKLLIPVAVLLGGAPFYPQPHIVEKILMLLSGTLSRPIDVFDLLWHAWPFALLSLA